jgi:hypothetical protein
MSEDRLRLWSGGGQRGFHFWCPGCEELHTVRTEPPGWGFNGDRVKPTFTPSVLVRSIRAPGGRDAMTSEEEAEYDAIFAAGGREAAFTSRFGTCCHSFVRDGRIEFLSDCTHAMAGQTVDLPPIAAHFPD